MNNKQEPRPRTGATERQHSKIPLTYYRSAETSTGSASPFKAKEEKKASKLRVFLMRLSDILIVLALLAVLIYSLLVKSDPKVVLSSTTYHSKSAYEDAGQKYLGSLKNHNKITLNTQAVVESLQKRFPEIASADVELPLLAQTPVIHIDISQPAFLLSSGGNSYIVDTQGVAVGKSSTYPSIKNLTTITDQSSFVASTGKQVMSADAVKFIKTLVAQLQHAKVPVSSITLPPKAQELDLRTSDQPYFVKFYLGGDPLQQAGQLLATRTEFQKTHTTPSQYLDVRVAGKVFYK